MIFFSSFLAIECTIPIKVEYDDPVPRIISDDGRTPEFLNGAYNWASETGLFVALSIDSSDTGLHYGRKTVNVSWAAQTGRWVGFKIALDSDSLPDKLYFYFKSLTKSDSLTIRFFPKNTFGGSALYKIAPPKMQWVLVELNLTNMSDFIPKENLKELIIVYENNYESGSFCLDGLALIH